MNYISPFACNYATGMVLLRSSQADNKTHTQRGLTQMGIFNNASIKVEGRKVYINGDAITFESEAEATEFVLELTKRLIQDR